MKMCLMPVVYVVLTGKIKPQVRPNYVRTAPVLPRLTLLFSIFFQHLQIFVGDSKTLGTANSSIISIIFAKLLLI